MSQPVKTGKIVFGGASPMSLIEEGTKPDFDLDEGKAATIEAAGTAIRAYVKAAKELLEGKFSHLKAWAPPHLVEPTAILVACCPEGIVVRYEIKSETHNKMFVGWMPGTLSEVASLVSQKLIHINSGAGASQLPEEGGTEISLLKTSPAGENTVLVNARIWFAATLTPPPASLSTLAKPFCLLSVRNTLEFRLLGEILSTEPGSRPAQPFLMRTSVQLPVGWECIEVFPGLEPERWKADNAATWAEGDILAAVVSHQVQEEGFNTLDPKAAIRRHFVDLLDSYRQLLDTQPNREEILQAFLAANPSLLCPTFTRFWPKLRLGAHITDFVFQEATGDYVLVELERSTDQLFVKTGHPSYQLTHARGQVVDWRRYLEDNLATVQRELGLTGISASPKCLIVIGRAAAVSEENRRKLAAIENEAPRLKILTYDDVLSNAKAVLENILGPLWNVQGNTQIYYLPPATEARKT